MTILSREHRLIFVHLHKCGGTSVEKAYEKIAHWSDLVIGSTDVGEKIQPHYRKKFGLTKHSRVKKIVSVVGAEFYSQAETFALVRNPFAITESFFGWIGRIFTFHANRLSLEMETLREIVRSQDERAKDIHFASWGSARAFAVHDDFNDFTALCLANDYLPGNSMARRLEYGSANQPEHIFKLEQMDRFWLALEHYLGKDLPRLHSNRTRNAPVYHWSADNLSGIRERYAEDFEVFGYPDTRK